MDVLARIEELRKQKGWTMYKLGNEAGLTPSTLTNMYTRGTSPSIGTLSAICAALGVSMSEFFNDALEQSDEETHLLAMYHQLTAEQKKAVQTIVEGLAK